MFFYAQVSKRKQYSITMNRTPPTSPSLPLQASSFGGLNSVSTRRTSACRDYPISPSHDIPANLPSSSLECLLIDLSSLGKAAAPSSPSSPIDQHGGAISSCTGKDIPYDDASKLLSRQFDMLTDPSLQLSVNPLGHGSYSYVYEIAGRNLAIKFPQSKRKSKIIINEAKVLSYLYNDEKNKHIVPYFGISYINKSHYRRLRSNEFVPGIIMPKFNMNLQQFYKTQKENVIRDNWWKLTVQMLNCLDFLKSKKVIHGDIKTANILVDCNFDFFLADFTSVKILSNSDTNKECSSINTTMEYCAPEMIKNSIETFDTDLYALGLCLLSVITKNEPYEEVQRLKSHGMQRSSSSIQQSQWLMNAILKNDPLKLNILNDDDDLYKIWSKELSFLSLILTQRLPLDQCLAAISLSPH